MKRKKMSQIMDKYYQDGLISLVISFARIIYWPILGRYYRVRSSIKELVYKMKYGDAAPLSDEIIFVDPCRIEYYSRRIKNVRRSEPHIIGGDWDVIADQSKWFVIDDWSTVRPLKSYVFYQSAIEHFEKGIPWEETEWFNWIINNPGGGSHYQNEESTRQSLEQLDQLYDHMRINGYVMQRDMSKDECSPFSSNKWPSPEYHEVTVMIGRKGDLIACDGRHRLTVARLLGDVKIPVRVWIRHENWQKLRVNISNGTMPKPHCQSEEFLHHPDTKNLFKSSYSDAIEME